MVQQFFHPRRVKQRAPAMVAHVQGGSAVQCQRQNSLGCRPAGYIAKAIVLAGVAVLALGLAAGSAAAQNGIFDTILGRHPPGTPATAYADPSSTWNPLFGSRGPVVPRSELDGSAAYGAVAYCVRLCDGRFFPIERQGGISPEQTCASFCPASPTRIYSGSSIEQAVALDGRRYADLGTAFVYRAKIIEGCTCNGKDALGVVNAPIKHDPTLRAGDIVATDRGLMVYNSGSTRQNFTPVAHAGLPAELRRKLAKTYVVPALKTAAPAADPKAR